jgi:hypothetical protein
MDIGDEIYVLMNKISVVGKPEEERELFFERNIFLTGVSSNISNVF